MEQGRPRLPPPPPAPIAPQAQGTTRLPSAMSVLTRSRGWDVEVVDDDASWHPPPTPHTGTSRRRLARLTRNAYQPGRRIAHELPSSIFCLPACLLEIPFGLYVCPSRWRQVCIRSIHDLWWI